MLDYYTWCLYSLIIIGLLFLEYFKESYTANIPIIYSGIQHSFKRILAHAMKHYVKSQGDGYLQ